jgi:hypothetical protein
VKPSPGTLPKFQFAFGGRDAAAVPAIKTEPGLVVVKSEPVETSNGKMILAASPAQSQQQNSAVALKGPNLISLPNKPGTQIVVQVSTFYKTFVSSSMTPRRVEIGRWSLASFFYWLV